MQLGKKTQDTTWHDKYTGLGWLCVPVAQASELQMAAPLGH